MARAQAKQKKRPLTVAKTIIMYMIIVMMMMYMMCWCWWWSGKTTRFVAMLSRRTDMFVRAHTCLLDGESVSCNLTSNMDTPELSTLKSREVLRFSPPSLSLAFPLLLPSSLSLSCLVSPLCLLLWCNAITSANFTNPTKYEDVAEILDYNVTTEVAWKRGEEEWHKGHVAWRKRSQAGMHKFWAVARNVSASHFSHTSII